MKSLVIFDLDGTLLNTIDDLGVATNFALSKLGYPTHPLQAYTAMVGNGVRRLIERALPRELNGDKNLVDRTIVEFKEYYDAHSTEHSRPYPGIVELLTALSNQNIALAVASNKYDAAVKRLIQYFFPDMNWVAVCGHKDGIPVKPDPSIVFEILNVHPTPKSEVLYVGDSGVDMTTANRACVESVGVSWGFRPVSELKETFADHIINRPDEILSLI